MDIASLLLPATAFVWQPRAGHMALTVVVKATLDLVPGALRLANAQDPLHEHDQHWDDDPGRFLVAATDLAPAKSRVDVLYLGPVGTSAGQSARLVVGPLDKTVDVRGERWALGPVRTPTSPEAESWRREWATRPRPDAVSSDVFNVAPRDQQLDALADDAPILLERLAPAAPRLASALPGFRPTVQIDLRGGGAQPVGVRLDTVSIEGPRGAVTLVWRGHVAIDHPTSVARVVVAADAQPSSRPSIAERRPARTALGTNHSPAASLPFVAGARAAIGSSASGWGPPATVTSVGRETAEIPAVTDLRRPAPAFGPPPSPRTSPPATRPIERVAAAALPAERSSPLPSSPSVPMASAPAPSPPLPAPAFAPPPPSSASGGGAWPSPSFGPTPSAPQMVARPAAVGPQHQASAALGGLGAASDAASDAAPRKAGGFATRAHRRPASGLRLLWHDPEEVLPVRTRPAWKAVLAKRELRPAERGRALESADAEDASEMLTILRDAEVAGESGIAEAFDRGFNDEGDFEPEYVLVEGDLVFDHDELETLRAVVATATPHASKDEGLRAAVDAASAFLAAPGLVSPPAVARSLAADVRKAWSAWAARPLPADHLDQMASRALLEKRAYQKRDVFGGPHLRASLFAPSSTTAIPTYVPEAAAKRLPLFLRIKSRAIALVHVREDEGEESTTALRVVALARRIGDEAPNA